MRRLPAQLLTHGSVVAGKGELEQFLVHLIDQLDACGFLRNVPKRPGMVQNVRHLFQRGEVTQQELRTLHGMVAGLALGRRRLGRFEDELVGATDVLLDDRWTAEERRVAQRLVTTGAVVEAVPTGPRRTPDFLVDGVPTELKVVSGVAVTTPDALSAAIASRIMDARSQVPTVLIDGTMQTGMTMAIALRGLQRGIMADAATGDRLLAVTVMTGAGDVTYRRASHA